MATTAVGTKWVYLFEEGNKDMRDLLGGKGAGVAEMTRAGLPVPPGFTITTECCNAYYQKNAFPEGMWEQVMEALAHIEEKTGKKFGDPERPLLVSVRSGAKFSMPGMMDTILNLGINADVAEGLAKLSGDERFALDAYRRFIQMFGKTAKGIGKDDENPFEAALEAQKAKVRRGHRRRPGRGRSSRAGHNLQGHLQTGPRRGLPRGPQGPAGGCHPGRVRLLDEPPRQGLPQERAHPRRPRHGGQRADHGLRQHGRRFRHRRRLHPRPHHRREEAIRRLPPQCAG